MDKELLGSLGMPGLEVTGKPETIQRFQYYLALGAFVDGWATLEYTFDLCVATIFHHAPEGRALAKRLPTTLSKKIELFRIAHDRIDALKPHAEMAGRIANAVEAIGKFRHLVFHSVQGFTDNPDVRDLRRMVLRANKRMEARVNLSVHDFAQMLRLITQMFDPLMKYARTLLTLFPKVQK